jgi:hypothetical protein
MLFATSRSKLERANIHASETAWVGTDFDTVIDNNRSIDDLYQQAKLIVSNEISLLPVNSVLG